MKLVKVPRHQLDMAAFHVGGFATRLPLRTVANISSSQTPLVPFQHLSTNGDKRCQKSKQSTLGGYV